MGLAISAAFTPEIAVSDDPEDTKNDPYHPATEQNFHSLELEAMSKGFVVVDPAEQAKEILVEYSGDKLEGEAVAKLLAPYKMSLLPSSKTVTIFEQSTICSSPSQDDGPPIIFSVAGFVAMDGPLDYLHYGRRVIDPIPFDQVQSDLKSYFKGRQYRMPLDGAVLLYGGKGRGTTFAGEPFSASRFNMEIDLNFHPLETTLFRRPVEVAFRIAGRDDGPPWIFRQQFDSLVKYRDGSAKLEFRPKNDQGTVGEILFEGETLLPVSFSLFFETGFERFGRRWDSRSLFYKKWAEWDQDDGGQWYMTSASMTQYHRTTDPKRRRTIRIMHSAKRMKPSDPKFEDFFSEKKFGKHVPPIELEQE